MLNHLFFICCCFSSFFLFFVHGLIEQTKPIYGSHQLITYITDWDVPKSIPWKKLDHIAYAFAVPDKDGELTMFDKRQLKKIVKEANHYGKGVSLAIGGWTGSMYFSSLLRTSHTREKFARILVNAVDEFQLNGLNIDWEYPNDPNGISCNRRNPKDTANFLSLIKLLRRMLERKYPNEHKLLTTAVSAYVFLDENRQSIQTLDKDWGKHMDGFYIMAYDITGSWSNTTSANAPLHNGKTGSPVSGNSAIRSWINAGIPADRIYLGVPFYGYTHKTTEPITLQTGMNVPFDRSIRQIKGDQYDGLSVDPCAEAHGSYSGEYQWRSLAKDGVTSNESGWASYWDKKTTTPYSYNNDRDQFVTYDSPASLQIKAQYVRKHRLGGIMVWSLEMDDESNSLLSAVQDVRT